MWYKMMQSDWKGEREVTQHQSAVKPFVSCMRRRLAHKGLVGGGMSKQRTCQVQRS